MKKAKTRYWMRVYKKDGESILHPVIVYSEEDINSLRDNSPYGKAIFYKQHAFDDRIFFCMAWVDSCWRFLSGLNLEEARADLESLL